MPVVMRFAPMWRWSPSASGLGWSSQRRPGSVSDPPAPSGWMSARRHRWTTFGPQAIAPRFNKSFPGLRRTSHSGSLANRQGRVLGTVLAGGDATFGPIAGAAAVKVFDLNVASVGCTAYRLAADGLGVRRVWISAEDCAHYWPEAKLVLLEMVYDPATRRVLGVQGVSEGGEVAKRIDVAAQLVLREATIDDFIDRRARLRPALRAGARSADGACLRRAERARRNRGRVPADGSVLGNGPRCPD